MIDEAILYFSRTVCFDLLRGTLASLVLVQAVQFGQSACFLKRRLAKQALIHISSQKGVLARGQN